MPAFTNTRIPPLHDPSNPIGAALNALRDQGLPVAHVIHIEDTGQVLMDDGSGEYRPAHGAIREMVTGEPWRDPGGLNPVPSHAVRRSPTRLAAHEAEVRDMWRYLVLFYRPQFRALKRLDDYADETIARFRQPHMRRGLAAMADNYERWDAIISVSIETLEEIHGPKTAAD